MTPVRHSRVLRTIVVLFAVCLLTFPAQAQYSGGTGEPNDPYQIATAADLIALGETPEDYDKHFILTADIDLDPNLTSGKVFERAVISYYRPVGLAGIPGPFFSGVFAGRGHAISHLTITGGASVGLFGRLATGGEIRDLSIVDVNIAQAGGRVGGLVAENAGSLVRCRSTGTISGYSGVGGLVGVNAGGALMDCHADAEVSGQEHVGGLVGWNSDGDVIRCRSAGAVLGQECVGGLVGKNFDKNPTVTDCYSVAAVTGSSIVGGLIGESNGSTRNCYSAGPVSGSDSVGGLVGWCHSRSQRDRGGLACFWDTMTTGQTVSDRGTGLTTAQMQEMQTYQSAGWDFLGQMQDGLHEIWQMPEGGGYPALALLSGYLPPPLQGKGTPENPYLLHNSFELGAMAYYDLKGCYRLATSIDLAGVHWHTSVVPVFRGVFDGNQNVIRGLTISGDHFLGLFGRLDLGAQVTDLGVVDVNVISVADYGLYVGGLVGYNSAGLDRCYATGTVHSSGSYTGGLAGYCDSASVSRCHASVEVTGACSIGGVVGCTSFGAMTECYSTGTVTGTFEWAGGLVGNNQSGAVVQCYSVGAVSGDQDVGGLVGSNSGSVTDSYSTGAVSGDQGVGGLAGSNNGSLCYCYSTGAVSGVGVYVGGLVGAEWRSDSVTVSCFWDTETSGHTRSSGGAGKSTTQMQAAGTFLDAGWDFIGEIANGADDIWWIDEGKDYPHLWWER